jgi:hypothetical protein
MDFQRKDDAAMKENLCKSRSVTKSHHLTELQKVIVLSLLVVDASA